MEYNLCVRAFIDITRKDKANAYAERLFPGLPIKNAGRYWKDENQWEIRINHDVEYDDDKTALWESLRYFCRILPSLQITSGPNEDEFDVVVIAMGQNSDGTGLTWCSFELNRGFSRSDSE